MSMYVLLLAVVVSQPPQAPLADLPEPNKEHPVVFPKEVEGNVGRIIKIDGKSLGPITPAYYPGIRDSADVYAFDKSIIFCASKEGFYWVGVSTAVDGTASMPVWVKIKVGIPPPPVPPKPDPKPDPKPSPTPVVPANSFRVLITFDENSTARPASQNAVLFSVPWRKWLDSKTIMGPDNKQREYRIWPTSVNASYESPAWKTLFARPKTAPDWIYISNGLTGEVVYEGPLPASIEETKALISKYEKTGG